MILWKDPINDQTKVYAHFVEYIENKQFVFLRCTSINFVAHLFLKIWKKSHTGNLQFVSICYILQWGEFISQTHLLSKSLCDESNLSNTGMSS